MISVIYNILLILFSPVYVLFFLFSEKFRNREKTSRILIKQFSKRHSEAKKRIWFHSSSMGEFEQAKPVIELIKSANPEIEIISTFYSPSGYDNQKDYKFADFIFYLPFDFRGRTKRFVDLIKPDLVVFIRYDIWRNCIEYLRIKSVPTILIAATLPGSKIINSFPLIVFSKSNLNLFTRIYSFNENHFESFKKLNLKSTIIKSNDTRYDRILKSVETAMSEDFLPSDLKPKKTLVCGSTWEADEKLIIDSYSSIKAKFDLRLILVPHEPTENHIRALQAKIEGSVLLSSLDSSDHSGKDCDIIIVDSIGKLLSLYKYADLAYIGGAFGSGVHSVTEPAGYGMPLACGSSYLNSPDAVELVKLKVLTTISNSTELSQWITNMLLSESDYKTAKSNSYKYINSHSGSSKVISHDILQLIKI